MTRFTRLRPGRRRWLRLLIGVRQGLGLVGLALTSRWLVSLVGALAGSLLIWCLGPLLALGGERPFEDDGPRLGAVLGIMIAWGLLNQVREVRERQADRRLLAALTALTGDTAPRGRDATPLLRRPHLRRAQPALHDHSPTATTTATATTPPEAARLPGAGETTRLPGAGEIATLSQRLSGALAAYGRRRGGHALRRQPWYLVIGVPGAGKTTALANSDLTFPLSDTLGHHPIQGVAGTRTCDWWFTAEAVLVDTAGRYTTQDSNQPTDSAAWLGLLDLLKEHRPAQPINGIVIAVSLEDLATQSIAERHLTAQTLHHRLLEVDQRLGIRLPVYVLLTKADRLAGFAEFFADLDPEERRQVWGITFELEDAEAATRGDAAPVPAAPPTPVSTASWAAMFSGAFERLLTRLERRLLNRLFEEPDPIRRALIAGFPHQVASLRTVLTEFLVLAVRPAELEPRLTLRGVYFTSAKRQGDPLDRLAPELATIFGIDQPLPRPEPTTNHGLFLNRLFREVVFAEAHLAGRRDDDSAGPHRRHQRWALAALLLVTLALAGWWGQVWLTSHRTLDSLDAQLATAAAALPEGLGGGSRIDQVADTDVAVVLPTLAALRAIPPVEARPDAATPGMAGLDQAEPLARQAAGLYRRGLNRLLLPRLVLQLERVLALPDPNPVPERLYEALRVYLMLTGAAPLDRFAVTSWFTLDWITTLPGPAHEDDRRQLAAHLTALLDAPPPPTGSPAVVAEARARLTGYSLAERGYALVRALPAVRTLPGWRLADHVGASIGAVLARRSARSLADPVPGLYTAAGARETVLPAIGRTAAELAGEGWVLGQPMDPAALIQRTRQWRQGITAAYFDDYGRQWQQFMADLTMEPAGAPARLLEQLDAVAGPDSALPRLIAAVVEQSQLVPPAPPGPQAGPPGQTSAAQLGLTAGNTVVTAIQPSAGDDDPASWWPAAAEVSARLQALAVLLLPGTPSNPAPLGAALAALTDLRQALGHWVTPPSIARPGAARSAAETEVRHAADRVKAQAQPLPAPVAGWFTGLADAAVRTLTTRPGAAP